MVVLALSTAQPNPAFLPFFLYACLPVQPMLGRCPQTSLRAHQAELVRLAKAASQASSAPTSLLPELQRVTDTYGRSGPGSMHAGSGGGGGGDGGEGSPAAMEHDGGGKASAEVHHAAAAGAGMGAAAAELVRGALAREVAGLRRQLQALSVEQAALAHAGAQVCVELEAHCR